MAELQQIDGEARKIISKGSTAAFYLARMNGGRELKSVEGEYKNIKIKAEVKLYESTDPSMATVRKFFQKSMKSGRHSFVEDAQRFAEECELLLQLNYPESALIKEDGELITGSKVKACLDTVRPTISREGGIGEVAGEANEKHRG